jgi:preprotein translocase subunit SecF
MFIVKYRKFFFILSSISIALSFYAVIAKGFNAGIDFKGGSISQVTYEKRPDAEALKTSLDKAGFADARIQMAGDSDVTLKTKTLTEAEHQNLLTALNVGGTLKVEEKQFSSIGPTIGQELRSKAWIAVILVILGIMLFIAYAFRKVTGPISSWKYGLITTLTLFHDIIVPAGVFVWLGKEVDSLFVVALLSVMGVSVHDTIVVFDRIRENLKLRISNDFETTVGKSIEETFTRSVNTSLTVMLVLAALYFFGPATTKDFSLILWIGVFVGTYSSIFIASPLLVVAEKRQQK